jgi:hypothetical protein
VHGPTDFQAVFAAMAEQRPDALVVLEDALTIEHRKEIVDFAPPPATVCPQSIPTASSPRAAG